MSAKVEASHLGRNAVIYIRQSTFTQVERNRESGLRQYNLVSHALELGWGQEQIVVIDEDQGRSGATTDGRVGFSRLMSDVALGQVGVVLAIEASRLARNSADWQRLIWFCSMTETLVGDQDGLYDPCLLDDRMVLGLKGTISELEWHTIRKRMREAAVCKARRGELEITLPAGLEWDGPNGVCLCPDQQVIDTLQMVFDKFDEIGTARQTALWLRDSGVQLPRRRSKSEIHWVEPNPSIVCAILSNPAYAGAYAYGRRRTVQQLHPDGAVQRRQVEVAQDDWTVLINDHHEGLISWERFQKIQQRLMQNYTKSGLSTAGPAREGAALLQGLVYCGKCGRKMHVVYRNRAEDRITQVVCRRVWNDSDTGGYCQVLGQRAIQQRVVELFLQTVQPAGVQVALRALEALKQERDTVCRHWSQCIERADYEANRACQRYEAVDPANRLVAAELERRWNEALDRAASVRRQAEEKLASLSRELSDEEVERVERMAQDVERLWNAPSTGVRDRKRLLRAAIERVVVIGEDNIVKVAVEWKGGEVTELSIKRPRRGIPTRVTPSEVVALVRKLAAELDDVQIARVLSRQGHKTATGLNFTKRHVQSIRAAHQIPCPTRRPTDGQPQHTADQAARELGVSSTTIHQWLRTGILRGHQLAPGAPWRIKLDEETRRRLAGDTAPDGWVGVEQAAVRLGVSKQTVITWVKEGKLQAVRVASGRRTAWRICVDSTGCEKQLALI